MKRLLFFTAAALLLLVESAVADPPSFNIGERTSKWAGSSSYSLPVCHLVKERVGTRHGHAVYRTLQVC